jgi:DNA-binding NarL/FixJ family response regulator
MKQHPILSNIQITECGKVYSNTSCRYLKTFINENGYEIVNITISKNEYKKYRVHRLVAETYLLCNDDRNDVHHKDHNKLNNAVSNLEWCHRSKNIKEAIKAKVNLSEGQTHSQAKYTDKDINQVCNLLCEGFRNKDISLLTGVKIDTISKIRSGQAWTHLSCAFNMPVFHRKGRLSLKRVQKVCEMLQSGDSNVYISSVMKLSKFTISKIRGRKIYESVSINYSF